MTIKYALHSRISILPLSFVLLFVFIKMATAGDLSGKVLTFDYLYEPSGVVQVKTGEVIIVEDEGDRPLYLVLPQKGSEKSALERGEFIPVGVEVDDLEAITVAGDSTIFAITSHSVTRKGKRKEGREQLLRLKVQNNTLPLTGRVDSLQPQVVKRLQQVSGLADDLLNTINIEGLSFDSSGKRLLVGLRTPTYNGKAIILEILNPFALFEEKEPPLFSDQVILLDVGGSGIRAMEYFPQLNRYLVVSEITNKKGKKRSIVWSWDGTIKHLPMKVELPKLKGITNIEGIAPVVHENRHYLLIVCDDGERDKKEGAHYVLISNTEFAVN